MPYVPDERPIVVEEDRRFSLVGVEVIRWTGVIVTILVVAYILTHWFGLTF